ncbi:Uncharacterized conserved protein YgbK, DUF1537 family [Paramicrobacterium humi]|uniref:3-oxo-tetronate kinase n=1 Tax=Paramicrobacterium humi TaxID=640635 RepID=A0A1H4LAS8_9MICO|nr:3-oxo-tetronate kinase [Microbacterium humi]SEB67880.1 Uncharacterized conserved protein YgbK, DUF1537 family [Microbacterium humi]
MIGAIADDFTGATDVAVAFRRQGLRVRIVFGCPDDNTPAGADDVTVVALKSRTIPAADAVEQSVRSATWLRSIGCEQLYLKYCSTFDSTPAGNIGPVADALADLTGSALTVVTPSSPVHGRTVYGGHLFVGTDLLSESSMLHHPLTPMTDSSVVRLLSAQTDREAALIPEATVANGTDAIAAALRELRDRGIRYAVVDAIDAHDLEQLGGAVARDVLVTGAAGLAEGLAAAQATASAAAPTPPLDSYATAAALAGSCSARTREQVARFAAHNPAHFLDPASSDDPRRLADAALDWFDAARRDGVPLIYSTTEPEKLRAAQERFGVDRLAHLVETALGYVAIGLIERGVDRIVVAGGETSGSVTSALGVRTATIGEEQAPGVPWLHIDSPKRLALLLKSGNFGDEDLLITATGAQPA